MTISKLEQFEQIVAAIQGKWGIEALRPLSSVPIIERLGMPTGYTDLDQILGRGGIPRACLTSFIGSATSGIATLAYCLTASAQIARDVVVTVDLPACFDPETATRYGVDLDQLLLVYPRDVIHGFEIVRDLLSLPCSGLIVVDLTLVHETEPEQLPLLPHVIDRLEYLLRSSRWTLLLLLSNETPFHPDTQAALRLVFERHSWLRQEGDIFGYRVSVTVAKNKFAPLEPTTTVDIFVE